MTIPGPAPTVLAVSSQTAKRTAAILARAEALAEQPISPGKAITANRSFTSSAVADGLVTIDQWGVQPSGTGPDSETNSGPNSVIVLSRTLRRHEHVVSSAEAFDLATGTTEPGALAEVLPPFAALAWGETPGCSAVVDGLGFRHVYARTGDDWAGLSTSAGLLATCSPTQLDRTSVAVQALLGWQLGLRTPFVGVSKLAPGSRTTLKSGELATDQPEDIPFAHREEISLDQAVRTATEILRGYLESFIDETPDATLQLTGGQDSRILLGAIPPARRRGLKVMTLAVPGSPDVQIAADLAERYGLQHQIVTLDGLEQVSPDEAHTMAVDAATRLDCSADPLAWASLAYAESKVEQSPRLSGLGGEVTRGFYYFGRVRQVPVTRERVRRLAEWRMFTNEAVPTDVLDPEFATWARQTALDELLTIFTRYGPDWLAATDQFYLSQRMHRWAGVLATSTCMDRVVVNPMLDSRFLEVARGLNPQDKKSSRFLSRLSCSLDAELSAIPLDGRPAPQVYAYPSPANSLRLATMTGRKVAGKVRQRLGRAGRAPAGGEVLAAKLTDYYRTNPGVLASISTMDVFAPGWLEQVAEGGVVLAPAAAAMLVNLEVAGGYLGATA